MGCPKKEEESFPPSPPPPPSSDHETAIDELVKGRELLAKLGGILKEKTAVEGLVLVERISASLAGAIAMLRWMGGDVEGVRSWSSGDGRSENSGTGKSKMRKADGDMTGGTKKRRSITYSCTRITSKTLEDGYVWRKYGQKEIQNATHPRSYYRCTHKHVLGCQATRQAQRMEDAPSMFRITYIGHHTCREHSSNLHKHGSNSLAARQPYIISFGSSSSPLPPSAPAASMKTARGQEILSSSVVQSGFEELSPVKPASMEASSVPSPTVTQVSDGMCELGDVTSGYCHDSMDLEMDIFKTDTLFPFFNDLVDLEVFDI